MEDILTAAQKKAAKKIYKESLGKALEEEIRHAAYAQARKFVKLHRKEIESVVLKEFRRKLPSIAKKATQEATNNARIYIDV